MKRFWDKVKKTESCWLWTAAVNVHGYGRFLFDGKSRFAHRVVLILNGIEIPKGMVVDHKCRVRNCVNPEHLRVVTKSTNSTENSISPPAKNKHKTHCLLGHEFNNENTIIYKNKTGKIIGRLCLECKNTRPERERSAYWNKKGGSKKPKKQPKPVDPKISKIAKERVQKTIAMGTQAIGESHGKSKFKKEDIFKIRSLINDGLKLTEIGKMFNVTPNAIGSIKRGETWGWLK